MEWTDAQLGSIITQSPAQLYGTVQQPTTVSDLIDWLNANLGGNWDIFSFGVAGVYSTGAIAGGPLESYGVPPGSTLDVGQTGTDTTTTPSGDKVLGYGLLALALVWGVKQFI
ncbi:MAG TPA: hypothetical protein VGS20_00010 [Candidatus Acidoferrales bacterium]|nr:hypothetical protein [Candidatus Acidoferrales bacterium]